MAKPRRKARLTARLSEAQKRAHKWIKREQQIDQLAERLTTVSPFEIAKKAAEYSNKRKTIENEQIEIELFFLENPEWIELAKVHCEKTGTELYSLPGELVKTTVQTLGKINGAIAIENLKRGQVHPLALFTDPKGLARLFKNDIEGYCIFASALLLGKENNIKDKITARENIGQIGNLALLVETGELLRIALSLGTNEPIKLDESSLANIFTSESTIKQFNKQIRNQYKRALLAYCGKQKHRWINEQTEIKTRIAIEFRNSNGGLLNFAKQKNLKAKHGTNASEYMETLALELAEKLNIDLFDEDKAGLKPTIPVSDTFEAGIVKELDFALTGRKEVNPRTTSAVPFHLQVKKAEKEQAERKQAKGQTGLAAMLAKLNKGKNKG